MISQQKRYGVLNPFRSFPAGRCSAKVLISEGEGSVLPAVAGLFYAPLGRAAYESIPMLSVVVLLAFPLHWRSTLPYSAADDTIHMIGAERHGGAGGLSWNIASSLKYEK